METKKHVRELLPVYLDQMCSEEEKKVIEAHLPGCVECRQELEDLRKTIKLVTGLKEIEPPDNLWEGVEQRIRKKSLWEIFVWRPVPVAVTTMVILFLAVTVNKYTTRIAEQTKTGTMHDVTVGANMPLVSPFVSPKPFALSIEKKVAGKAKASVSPAPAVDNLRYESEVASKDDKSEYVSTPQESRGMTTASQTMPSFSTIEMEVQDMEQSMQRLDELAQNYQAERVSQYGDNGALVYQVHQQKLDGFVRDLNKVGKISQHEAEYERLKVSPAYGGLSNRSSSQPKLIQIKFNSIK